MAGSSRVGRVEGKGRSKARAAEGLGPCVDVAGVVVMLVRMAVRGCMHGGRACQAPAKPKDGGMNPREEESEPSRGGALAGWAAPRSPPTRGRSSDSTRPQGRGWPPRSTRGWRGRCGRGGVHVRAAPGKQNAPRLLDRPKSASEERQRPMHGPLRPISLCCWHLPLVWVVFERIGPGANAFQQKQNIEPSKQTQMAVQRFARPDRFVQARPNPDSFPFFLRTATATATVSKGSLHIQPKNYTRQHQTRHFASIQYTFIRERGLSFPIPHTHSARSLPIGSPRSASPTPSAASRPPPAARSARRSRPPASSPARACCPCSRGER